MLPWRYVVIDAGRGITVPTRCARCDAPPTTAVVADHVLAPLKSVPATLRIPYCDACGRLVVAAAKGRFAGSAGLVVVGGLLGAAVAWGTSLAPPLVAGLAVVAAWLASAIVFATMARPTPKVPVPAEAAVAVRSVAGWTWTLVVRRGSWADELAELNGALCREMPVVRPATNLLVAGLASAAALGGATGSWLGSHRQVYVDNATEAPVMVWVDGKARTVIAPGAPTVEPPSVWVSRGNHAFGESGPDDRAPRASTTFNVTSRALYSPGNAMSYWRSTVVYGKRDDGDHPGDGPIPPAPVISLEGIKDVLEKSPSTIQIERGDAGARARIDRDMTRAAFVSGGCSERVVRALDSCRVRAATTADVRQCIDAAKTACVGER